MACGFVRLFPEMHDGRKDTEQDVGMIAREGKIPADTEAIPAAIDRANGTIERGLKKRVSIDRCQSRIACKAEGCPRGSRKQSPFVRCTGSGMPSTESQHWPETKA